ncbi:uncharacterized protein LOC119187259 [Rhipicephalus microplus]|uniref:uncharacterized protein LOC119187259 n=1 Tax=Rhipicephalus microplus TaxID=6941 RepID=UPI003F6B43E7
MASESSACDTSAHSAIECVNDNESSSPDVDVLRANITDERHACSWVEDYGLKTNTSWVVDFVKPTAKCERMVFHKVWRCKEAKREKSCGEAAAHCPVKIDLKIKKVNRNTKCNDAFLREEKPLPAVIKLFHHKNHSHSTAAADALSRLTPTMQTRETSLAYFDNGMSPAEAIRLHESKLLLQEDGYALVANSAVNPLPPAIYYWYRLWRENFGKDVDPLLKIAEKMPLYAKHGIDVKLGRSEDGQCWVVLVATPIMRRAQLLNAAKEIIFIDSTSSCDTSRSTVTVLLAATNAGAVPIAVLIHNSQSAQGYCTAFTLLKDTFPTCFGRLSVSYLADKNSQVWILVSVQIRAGFGVKEQQPCVP